MNEETCWIGDPLIVRFISCCTRFLLISMNLVFFMFSLRSLDSIQSTRRLISDWKQITSSKQVIIIVCTLFYCHSTENKKTVVKAKSPIIIIMHLYHDFLDCGTAISTNNKLHIALDSIQTCGQDNKIKQETAALLRKY